MEASTVPGKSDTSNWMKILYCLCNISESIDWKTPGMNEIFCKQI